MTRPRKFSRALDDEDTAPVVEPSTKRGEIFEKGTADNFQHNRIGGVLTTPVSLCPWLLRIMLAHSLFKNICPKVVHSSRKPRKYFTDTAPGSGRVCTVGPAPGRCTSKQNA